MRPQLLRATDLQVLEYIKQNKGSREIEEAFGISRDSQRALIKRLRRHGYCVPRRSPSGVISKRNGVPTCVLNTHILDMRRDLAAIQTHRPEHHLNELRKHPPYQDVVFKRN